MACRKRVAFAVIFPCTLSSHTCMRASRSSYFLTLGPSMFVSSATGVFFSKIIPVKGKGTSAPKRNSFASEGGGMRQKKRNGRDCAHQNLIKSEPFHYTAWINRWLHGWCHYFDLFSVWVQYECRFFRNMCETFILYAMQYAFKVFCRRYLALHTHNTHIPNICHTLFDCGIALPTYLNMEFILSYAERCRWAWVCITVSTHSSSVLLKSDLSVRALWHSALCYLHFLLFVIHTGIFITFD